MKIEELDISEMTKNSLIRHFFLWPPDGIRSKDVSVILKYTDKELLDNVEGLGKIGIKALKVALSKLGLSLRGSILPDPSYRRNTHAVCPNCHQKFLISMTFEVK